MHVVLVVTQGLLMTTEKTPTIEILIDTTKGAGTEESAHRVARGAAAKERVIKRSASERPARKSTSSGESRSKRKKTDYTSLKVMLTTGAFLATWMGTGWVAQQDAIAAAAQANQSQSGTVAYVAPDGTISEQVLNLEPIPQVVVSSNSSN